MNYIIDKYYNKFRSVGSDKSKLIKLYVDMLHELSDKSAFVGYKECYNMFTTVWHEAVYYVEQEYGFEDVHTNKAFLDEVLWAYTKFFEPTFVDFLELANSGRKKS
jgi:hypothetical protein